jgi:PPP family 3-phenylpropionic acid transporter
MVLGGAAGILRWSLAGMATWLPFVAALQLLHALTFGASHLGAMHFLSRAVPLWPRPNSRVTSRQIGRRA